jgi:hypothetical protein
VPKEAGAGIADEVVGAPEIVRHLMADVVAGEGTFAWRRLDARLPVLRCCRGRLALLCRGEPVDGCSRTSFEGTVSSSAIPWSAPRPSGGGA